MLKNGKFILTEKYYVKSSSLYVVTYAMKTLHLRNFCQKSERVNFRNIHTVAYVHLPKKIQTAHDDTDEKEEWLWNFYSQLPLLQEIVDLYFTAINSMIPFDCYSYSHVKKNCLFHFITLSGLLSIKAVCYDDWWQPWIKSWWCSVPRVGCLVTLQ